MSPFGAAWLGWPRWSRAARERIQRQQAQTDAVDFLPWLIEPRKYRSEARREILVRAALVLAAHSAGRFSTDFGTMNCGP